MKNRILNKDILNLVRPNVLKLKPYASAKAEFKDFDEDLIYLDANENPFENGWNRYPDPNQTELKKSLSKLKNIPTKNILLGNGSDEILDMIFRIFCHPERDNVIINIPTFGMYNVLAGINNVFCRKIQLTSDFQLDVDAIKKQTDEQTKIVFICSPNNPTGNLIAKKDIINLLESLNVVVVIDEAYIDFSNTTSWLKEIKNYPNLVVTQTLSKAYGLAGLRLGICYANEDIIEILKKIKMPYNINVLTQINAKKYLENRNLINNKISKILENKSRLKKELEKITCIKRIFNSDTNFLLVKVDDADKRYQQLIANGIVVRNRNKEPLCENCLRITVGTEKENQELIKVLNKIN